MENEQQSKGSVSWGTYVVGAIIVLAVVGGAWYFRTMSPSGAEPTLNMEQISENTYPAEPTSTPGPIAGLDCDSQYFNPKVGFNEYYLNAEGGDTPSASTVSCQFVAKVNDQVVGQTSAQSALTPAPARNGSTFRCTTEAIALEPNVLTTIDVTLTDDLNVVSTCSSTFTFPQS